MTIAKLLDLSTAYITVEDGENLTDPREANKLIVRAHDHGWFIHVPQEPSEYSELIHTLKPTFSPAFIEVMQFAHNNGCWWVNLDEDGENEATLARVRDEDDEDASPTAVFNDLNPGQRARLFTMLEKYSTKDRSTPSGFASDDGALRKLWREADSHVRGEFQHIAGCKPVSE